MPSTSSGALHLQPAVALSPCSRLRGCGERGPSPSGGGLALAVAHEGMASGVWTHAAVHEGAASGGPALAVVTARPQRWLTMAQRAGA